ncbi:unnamed protein product, partial [Polarella glacialis]
WLALERGAVSFFSSEPRDGEGGGSEDPLVDVVRRDSHAASRFITAVMIISGVGSLIVCAACLLYLHFFWTSCGRCNRPVRWWLLVLTVLQALQIPVRVVFLAKLRTAQRPSAPTGALETAVARFMASRAWRWSKNVSLFTYVWYILGIVWVVNAGRCPSCPGIYGIVIFVIAQAVLRATVALMCFRQQFPPLRPPESPAKVEAATADEISALPLECFESSQHHHNNNDNNDNNNNLSCAVCLSDYVDGEVLRRLPCQHIFHRRCADEWLRRSKRCPLCVQSITLRSKARKLPLEL